MEIRQAKSAKELCKELNISHPTFKKRIKEKLPIMYAIWYTNKRKDLYYPNEIDLILTKVM